MSAFEPVELAFDQAGGEGDTNAKPLVILHGFLGSGRNWQSLAKKMAQRRHVVWADMRNHGASPWSDIMNYTAMADDIVGLIDRLGAKKADLVGHSMGGKAAMMTALRYGARIDRLVVVDIAPVAYDHGFDDIFQAMRSLQLDRLERRSEADDALSEHLKDPGLRAFVLQNLDIQASPPRWRCNLDVLERTLPGITGWEVADDANTFHAPTLFLYGGRSDYVTEDSRPVAHSLFSHIEWRRIDKGGHWVHADSPNETLAAIEDFLSL